MADKKAYQLDDAVGLLDRQIWSHSTTIDDAERIDPKHYAKRGYSDGATINNNSTQDIIIGDKTKDGWIKIEILGFREGSGYLKWELQIINNNDAITINDVHVQERIGGSNFGLTFTNLYYDSNNIKLTMAASNATYNISLVYKISIINFNPTSSDFEIY